MVVFFLLLLLFVCFNRIVLSLIFFKIWIIFKVLIEFVTILLLFYIFFFLTVRHMGFSSPTRNQTCIPCLER